jgi:phosphoserine aminotransferase
MSAKMKPDEHLEEEEGPSHIYNFSAGPAALPEVVMERAQAELLDYEDTGMSVMSLSHRSAEFERIAEQSEADLRELLAIPDDYSVLFLQGGATLQFAMAPLNLLGSAVSANYVNTGYWSAKAIREARRFCQPHVCADGAAADYSSIPAEETWRIDRSGAYLHYTPNETIGGVEFHFVPAVERMPLVADMSSTLLSKPIDVSRFALIYAGAQKNIGPAGLTIVILRDDMVRDVPAGTPSMLDYRAHRGAHSRYNTPPTFAWYMAGLTFSWLKQEGGLAEMARRCQIKSELLYGAIDRSNFYSNTVDPRCRSRVTVPFRLTDSGLEPAFLQEAAAAGLANLKGHRSIGGVRASLYNGMPIEGVETLVEFMQEFERRYG